MDEQNWYDPLNQSNGAEACADADASPKKKAKKTKNERKTKRTRIWAIIALVILLLIGSSLAFSNASATVSINGNTFSFGSGKETDNNNGRNDGFGYYIDPGEKSDMPDDFKDFFSAYYTETDDDSAGVNIPKTKYSGNSVIEATKSEAGELSLQELYSSCVSSVVAISGYVNDTEGYYWGTGIILSSDGLVLTNAHVIEGCDSAVVTLSDDTEYEAMLIGADEISDIAVLKIEATGLPAAQLGESAGLCVGDKVAAIGNPLGENFRLTLTDGIVSAIDRGISYKGHSMTLIQTNTALNSGNSGGALFDMYGRVVGVTNMKMMSSYSSIEGIGFAIPSDTVVKIVNSLISYGEVKGRPSIGITVGAIPSSAQEKYNMPSGLYISAVSAGSDAEKKGLKEGDVLMEVNGTPVTSTGEVSAIKDQLSVGDSINFKIWRNGETFNVDVILMDTNDIYG